MFREMNLRIKSTGSDNSFKRFRALVNFPFKLDDKGSYLVAGLEYRDVRFDYEDFTNFDSSNLEFFKSFEASLGYTFKLKNDCKIHQNTLLQKSRCLLTSCSRVSSYGT